MSTANRISVTAIICAAAIVFVAVMFVSVLQFATEANAQSSVRPPAGATQNAVPGSSGSRTQGRENFAPQNITGGSVPGGAEGSASPSDIWREIRAGKIGNVSIPDKKSGKIIHGPDNRLRTLEDIRAAVESRGGSAGNLAKNNAGIASWIAVRSGPLARYGLYAMGGMLVLLALFYLIRGRIRVEHGLAGTTILRFTSIERLGHWLLAISFIILALTGLNLLYGREFLIPLLGKETYAAIAYAGKYAHNYVAFAFMLALAMITVMWVRHNIPHPRDLVWLAKGGGMFSKNSHPSAKKFNAGQKILFWLMIVSGVSISMSGIALMFPFETAMFAKTFAFLNSFGMALPSNISPIEEQQYAALWHSIVALFMVTVIIAHIYIGSVGMEGAIDAMTTGRVDANWAREHHDMWAEEVMQREVELVREAVASGSKVQPAE